MTYRHTQPGTLTMFTRLFCGGIGAALAWHAGQWPVSIVLLVIMLGAAILFSSLTVEVSDNELRWYFGPGLWTYRLPLTAIGSSFGLRSHSSVSRAIQQIREAREVDPTLEQVIDGLLARM